MVVSEELILAGMSGGGGWNRAQLKLLGVSWPPRAGWKERSIGREISEADAQTFLTLKGKTRKKLRRNYAVKTKVPIELLRDAISVMDGLLESALMDVIIADDGRDPASVYGGELKILEELRSYIPSQEDSR